MQEHQTEGETMNKALEAIGPSIIAEIVTTPLFAYLKGEWPFER